MLKLRHFDRALRYEFRMDELKARQEVGAGGTAVQVELLPANAKSEGAEPLLASPARTTGSAPDNGEQT